MNYTINDKVDIGGYSFDLQVEVRRGYFVGEIFFQGKVLKRVEKPCPSTLSAEEKKKNVLLLYESLKRSLFSSLKKKVYEKNSIKDTIDEDILRKKLLSLLDISEDTLKEFFLKKKDLSVYIFDGKTKAFKISDWFDEILSSVNSLFIKNANFFIFSLKLNGEDAVLIFIKDNKIDLKLGLLVVGIKMSIIRNRIKSKEEEIFRIIEELSKK